MVRIRPQVFPVPITMTGMTQCLSRSTTLAQDQGAFCIPGENRPSMVSPVSLKDRNISRIAIRKLGTACPKKPMAVKA